MGENLRCAYPVMKLDDMALVGMTQLKEPVSRDVASKCTYG